MALNFTFKQNHANDQTLNYATWIKTQLKEAPKWVDFFKNCIFEKLEREHNSLDCQSFWEYGSITCKVQYSKFDANKKCFCMLKAIKYLKYTTTFFSNFLIKYGPFLLKIEEILPLMIKGTKK
jgi:hypothetical protein